MDGVQFGWKAIEKTDIKALKDISNKYNLSKAVYPLLFVVLSEKRCCIKKIGDILVEHLDYQRFRIAFSNFLDKQSKPKVKKYLSSGGYLASSHIYQSKKDDNMYEKFEYGLSDW